MTPHDRLTATIKKRLPRLQDWEVADVVKDIEEAGLLANEWNTGLPPHSNPVLALVGGRVLRAIYIHPKTVAPYEFDEDSEYDEAGDCYWAAPGWCEENQYEDVHWRITDPVDGWVELPQPPQADTGEKEAT